MKFATISKDVFPESSRVKPMKGLSQELDYMMRMRAEFAKEAKKHF